MTEKYYTLNPNTLLQLATINLLNILLPITYKNLVDKLAIAGFINNANLDKKK